VGRTTRCCETAVNSWFVEFGPGGCRRSNLKQRGAKAFDGEIVGGGIVGGEIVGGGIVDSISAVVVEKVVVEKSVVGVDTVKSVVDVVDAAKSLIFYTFVVATLGCFALRWSFEAAADAAADANTVYHKVANCGNSIDYDSLNLAR